MNILLLKFEKIILSITFAVLFPLMVCTNMISTMNSYHTFYYPENSKYLLYSNKVYTSTLNFLQNRGIRTLLNYSGFETCYGFFAPNVASDFIVEFTLLDATETQIARHTSIELHSKEGTTRVLGSYNSFLEYVNNSKDELPKQKADILLKFLSLNVLRKTPNANKIVTRLYLYDYPTLDKIKIAHNFKPDLVLIKKITYNEDNKYF